VIFVKNFFLRKKNFADWVKKLLFEILFYLVYSVLLAGTTSREINVVVYETGAVLFDIEHE
jgi:hypothetical protein